MSEFINKRLIEKIEHVEKEYGKTFSNTQKILLTTDGSITSILDVLNGKIEIKTIEQHFENSNDKIAKCLNINKCEKVNYRVVLMHKNEKPLIHAISYIPLKRLNDEIKADLIAADIPIGRILKKHKIESRREINNIQVEKTTPYLTNLFKTDNDLLTRDYTIIKDGEILMWIKELFPTNYFSQKDSIN